MLQNLAKCACTRRAGTSLTLTSPLSTGHAPKRFYATGKNEDLIRLLKERGSLDFDFFNLRCLFR